MQLIYMLYVKLRCAALCLIPYTSASQLECHGAPKEVMQWQSPYKTAQCAPPTLWLSNQPEAGQKAALHHAALSDPSPHPNIPA